ncbi:MAG: TolC family protein [Thermodesulfovibrionales bacterium]
MTRVLICMFLIMLLASSAYSMTMEEAVSYAAKNNSELQALRLEEEVAKGQREKARLLLVANPAIEGDLSKKDKPQEEGGGKFTNYGIKLSQEFEIAGQRGLRIDVAEKGLSKVILEIRDRERVLTFEVKDFFANALASKRKVELAKEAVKLQEELLDFTKIKLQAGDVSGLEVNLAEVELSKAKKELLSAGREYREALLALQGLLGLKPDNTFSIDGEMSLDILSLPDKESLKKLLSQRPDIKAASVDVDKTKSAVRLTSREAVPNITLSGFYDRDEQRNTVGLSLSIPLPLFDRKQAEKKESWARAEQAKIKSAALEKMVDKELEQAYSDLTSALEEVSLFKKEILDKAVENLSLLNVAYKEGKFGFFEVRLAQKDTIETQFAYLESQLRTQRAINAMEKVIGGSLK